MSTNTPILFLIFNRPHHTARSFDLIRAAQPKRLFIAADGPRKSEEIGLCNAAREIATQVDWACDVETLFRDRNLGCQHSVSDAITWFFSKVDHGIILEDDCLPSASFFPYCEGLLERYHSADEVMAICGNNFAKGVKVQCEDYFFSKYAQFWGWATWRDRWDKFDFNLGSEDEIAEVVGRYKSSRNEREFWSRIFTNLAEGRGDSWGYRWLYSVWKNHGLVVMPRLNLVENVGIGDNATHTKNGSCPPAESMDVTRHPIRISRNTRADRSLAQHCYRIPQVSTYRRMRFFLGRLRRKFIGS